MVAWSTADARERQEFIDTPMAIMNQIKREKSANTRAELGEKLERSVRELGPKNVLPEEIDAMSEMLLDCDDAVRYWIARSLGDIGPNAIRAAPILAESIAKIPYRSADATSEFAIRRALRQICTSSSLDDCTDGKLNQQSEAVGLDAVSAAAQSFIHFLPLLVIFSK